jgi:vacuolar-type H+-ATPase subunit I/STV1
MAYVIRLAATKVKARLRVAGLILICISLGFWRLNLEFMISFLWNNGLREAVVEKSFLFLSTFFIQVLLLSYKLQKNLSTRNLSNF